MPKLIIIRGNSGSGKTTLAKELQHKWGYNTMLISQDVIRREILYVKDGVDTQALPLLEQLLIYGKNNCEIIILEGIFKTQWYRPLFDLALMEFGPHIFAYYYNLSFEETMLRHQTKPNKDDFGENELRKWWNDQDYIRTIPEKIIESNQSAADTAKMIYQDVIQDQPYIGG